MEPFLKWAGGKSWLAERLAAEIIATSPSLYIEPFLGAGAVALALPRELTKHLTDINAPLMDVWKCVKTMPDTLARELTAIEAAYPNTKNGYALARDRFNELTRNPRPMWAYRSAHFLYLNARCFNGLWRTNSKGGFNVPMGDRVSPRAYPLQELLDYSKHLTACAFAADGFQLALAREFSKRIVTIKGDAEKMKTCMCGVAVYADPPYHDTFDGYAKGGFSEEDQELLAQQLASLAAAGASVWASNSDTEFTRKLYRWAQLEAVEEQHNVGSKANRRGKRSCLLIRAGAAIR